MPWSCTNEGLRLPEPRHLPSNQSRRRPCSTIRFACHRPLARASTPRSGCYVVRPWANKGCGESSEEPIAKQGSEGSILCFNESLQLLETMMKNCGEYVHSKVAEQHVLQEMVKIVQKKNDMQVRDKVLLLLDSWQEAFDGPGGKYPQYYWAYIELKRTGITFPRRPIDAPRILTPPAAHHSQSYGSPRYTAGSLNERMASNVETLSLADLNNIRNVTELLNDMVNALNPSDRTAVKDDIITDLVDQCRSNQQKLMQFVSSTGNEEFLKQGLEINDCLQSVLAKHDAVASGAPLAVEAPRSKTVEAPREDPTPLPSAPPAAHNKVPDEEEEDDEFAQIARRKSKAVVSGDEVSSSAGDLALVPVDPAISETSSSVASNALVPVDPALASSTRTKEQDMIDLLSLTLYSPTPEISTDSSTQSQQTQETSTDSSMPSQPQQPAVSNGPQYPPNYQPHPAATPGYTPYNNYVAPWSQAGAYTTQPPVYSSSYAAPPWATPGSANNTNPFLSSAYQVPNPTVASVSPTVNPAPSTSYVAPSMAYVPPSTPQPVQQYNSFRSQTNRAPSMAPGAQMNGNQRPKESPAAASKPYYIPDNLFGDLIDVKSFASGNKMGRSTSMPSPKGGQPMIGGKK